MEIDNSDNSRRWINTPAATSLDACRPRAPSLGCSELFIKDPEVNSHRVRNPLNSFSADLKEALDQACKTPYYTPDKVVSCSGELTRNSYRRRKRDWNVMEVDLTGRLSPISSLCQSLKCKRTFADESESLLKRPKHQEQHIDPDEFFSFCDNTYSEEVVTNLFTHYHLMYPHVDNLPNHLQGSLYISGPGLKALITDFGWDKEVTPGVTAFFYLLSTELLFAISLDEFHNAFRLLRTSSVQEAKERSRYYHREFVKDRNEHIQYASHSFKFFNGANQKAAPLSTVLKLLFLLMGSSSYFTSYFAQYLTVAGVQYLNFDQWRNFIPFSCEIYSDCSNYRESDAWPTVYDGFVVWFQGLNKVNCSSDQCGVTKRFMDKEAVLQMGKAHLV